MASSKSHSSLTIASASLTVPADIVMANITGSTAAIQNVSKTDFLTWLEVPKISILDTDLSSPSQATLQGLYDAEAGTNAPDSLPQSVVDAANALSTSEFKLYLGHTQWLYTNSVTSTTSNWTTFGGGKSNFNSTAHTIYTYR